MNAPYINKARTIAVNKIWETLVRFRTWIVNLVAALLIVLPDLLNAPEVIAVVPVQYQKYVFVAALLLNVLMRPRPAAMAHDPEVKFAKRLADDDTEHA
jgi:predicted cobalt transporter CbtA